jgi:uncharacterized Rmd1/YagE family protein
MTSSRFRALAIAPEIPLSMLAEHFSISRRFAWEEPLELGGESLKRALPTANGQRVFLFAFGAIVFVDCSQAEMLTVLEYLGRLHSSLRNDNPF